MVSSIPIKFNAKNLHTVIWFQVFQAIIWFQFTNSNPLSTIIASSNYLECI